MRGLAVGGLAKDLADRVVRLLWWRARTVEAACRPPVLPALDRPFWCHDIHEHAAYDIKDALAVRDEFDLDGRIARAVVARPAVRASRFCLPRP
jgi:hypothetical protein